MNDTERLSYIVRVTPYVHPDHLERQEKYHRTYLVSALIDRLTLGEWYTIKIDKREIQPSYDLVKEGIREFETTCSIGKVRPIYYEYKPKPKLTFRERLQVLFTGNIPHIEIKRG